MRTFEHARSYLNFRDLCATRAVCQIWNDIRSVPQERTVFFFEDDTNVDLPSSSDANFRKALLAATLHKLHCQIFNQEQLQFVLQLLPNVKELVIELDGRNGDHLHPGERPPVCDASWISCATKLRKLDLSTSNFDGEIHVDFAALKDLVVFETDSKVLFDNYDGREMECLGYKCDFWTNNVTEIALNTDVLRVSRMINMDQTYNEFADRWVRETDLKPNTFEVNLNGLTFFILTREAFTVLPIFNLPEAQYTAFLNQYRFALEQLFQRLPGHPLEFHDGCTEEMKRKWLEIINPIRESLGVPTY